MTAPAQPLELVEPLHVALVATPPHLPLILLDKSEVAALKSLESEVASLKITDAASYQKQADLLQLLTKSGTALEKRRKELNAPFSAQIDKTNALAKAPATRIETAKNALKVMAANFEREQKRLADEAEKARLAEIKRLQDIADAQAKAAQAKADKIAADLKAQQDAQALVIEAARKAGLPIAPVIEDESWEEEVAVEAPQKPNVERQIEALKFQPVATVIKPKGQRTITTLQVFVTNVALLPDIFVDRTAKIGALRQTFCVGFKSGDKIPECPGCRFEEQTSVQSTGKDDPEF
jgi:hypothetical protein